MPPPGGASRAVKAINGAGELLGCVLAPEGPGRERLMEAACKGTELSDWGRENFRAPLDRLLGAFGREADLSLLGRLAVRTTLVRLLSQRLKIRRDLARSPAILQGAVARPLFVLGLPRTGTTLLHRLLAQDPVARAPMWWELLRPSPPPDAGARSTDPRIGQAERTARRAKYFMPRMPAMHTTRATTLEECYMLFQLAFSTVFFGLLYRVPSYNRWLLRQDMRPAYRYYLSVLKLLQWRTPASHWVLKSPHHLFHLDALFAVFPDACVVHLHRDVSRAVASTCSLMSEYRQVNCRSFEPEELGRSVLETLTTGVERAMQARGNAAPARVLDLDYRDLVADPKGQVKRVYERFGYRFDERMDARMDRWLTRNRQHKYGVHRYTLEAFGLSGPQVRGRMAGYVRAYGLDGTGGGGALRR